MCDTFSIVTYTDKNMTADGACDLGIENTGQRMHNGTSKFTVTDPTYRPLNQGINAHSKSAVLHGDSRAVM